MIGLCTYQALFEIDSLKGAAILALLGHYNPFLTIVTLGSWGVYVNRQRKIFDSQELELEREGGAYFRNSVLLETT